MIASKFIRVALIAALLMLCFSDTVYAAIKKNKKSSKGGEEKLSGDLEKQGKQKQKELEEMEAKALHGIIEFNKETYMKYVVKNPRPYDVVVLYSVAQNCDHCLDVIEEYK
jgi:CRISPR/Cas system-associated protein endoribonuclease Cas2